MRESTTSMSSSAETLESRFIFNPYKAGIFDVYISAACQHQDRYQEEPMKIFISTIYDCLREAGVYVFGDAYTDRRSVDVTLLLGAIERSRVSIIVFTTSYGGSTLCLQELEKIMKCVRSMGQQIVPVFFGVDPSEIHDLTGHFGKALASTVRRESTNKDKAWNYMAALQEAAEISPRFMTDHRDAREDIDSIVDRVTYLTYSRGLFVAEHPVGIQYHVQELIQILDHQKSDDVLLLGIWGMGGIGKTMIAKAIYDQIARNFEIRKFVPDVRDRYRGISSQQEIFVSLSHKRTTSTMRFTDDVEDHKQYLSGKRSFFVFDDVNDYHHISGLRQWCGRGSRIIITSRDKRVLRSLGVDYIYRMNEMNYNECVELFSWYAFKKATPERNFAELIKIAVEYSDGLPVALIALGSLLFKRSTEEWQSALARLKRFPIQEVEEVLKTSFDDLDYPHKQIFLELAHLSSFFIGMDRDDIIQIFKRSRHGDFDIEILQDKCLVTFDVEDKLRMHPLLQDMGRKIYRKESSVKAQQRAYDVFLSFRGEDTRSKFVSHLHASLENANIYVYKDDDGLPRGEQISLSLLKAIGESKISIIVLSTNYANSRWCLQELEDIMICYRSKAQKVLPVFYDVDPSEVRNQEGKFGEAFEDLLKAKPVNKDKEQNWRKALCEVGCISGFVILKSRNESEDINNIVEHVTHILDMKDLFIANHPVGIETRVQEVIKLLQNQQSENTLLFGILGMGGVGKTTIAKAVYNKICREFEGRCFLLDIREVWDQDNGGIHLQEQLLSNLYKTTKIKIQNIEHGKSILEKRLREKRILLVLDDVDKLEQLKALAVSHKWFCPRSTVIITTRDKHLLSWLGVDKSYRLEILNEEESLELFSWHAFKEPSPRKEFIQLSNEVISYCGRLPLALEVIGSHLFNKGVLEWKSALKKLKIIPNEQVQEKLKISFDGLRYDEYKEIFLDIAFFFIGMERNDAIDILNGCEYPADIGIIILIEKNLIFVDTKNKLRMHDLLRDMGREIIRKKSPKTPEERTRVWQPQEVCDLLSNDMGTKAIEGLALKLVRMNPICLKTKAFKNMKRLKLLQLVGVYLDGDFRYLSRALRWLSWHGCPSTYSNANFDQGNVVAIDLKYSHLQLMWSKSQLMEKLKILNLSHSEHLTQTPDFSYLPNLEKLVLKYCPSLSSISHTIGLLKQVLVINFKGCISLRKLPRSIYKLKSLKTLILSGCLMIDKLEEDLEQMESLTTFKADNTAITQVPHAVIRLKSIKYVSLCGFEGLSRKVIPSIIWSWTSSTKLSPQMQIPVDLSCLVSITVPSSRSFHATSSIINELPNVLSLRSECGSQIQLIRDTANVTNCKELQATSATSRVSDMDTSVSVDCPIHQGDISEPTSLLNFILIQMGMSCSVTEILRESISQELSSSGSAHGDNLLHSKNVPDWTTFSSEGFSVFFDVSKLNGRNLKTMMLSIVYSSSLNIITSERLILKSVLIINHTKATTDLYKGDSLTSLRDEEGQRVISNLKPGDKVQIVVVLECGFIVRKTSVYLIYEDPIDQNIEQF